MGGPNHNITVPFVPKPAPFSKSELTENSLWLHSYDCPLHIKDAKHLVYVKIGYDIYMKWMGGPNQHIIVPFVPNTDTLSQR